MVNAMTSDGIWLFLFTFLYGQWTIETVYGVSFTTTSQYSGLIEEGVGNTHNWAVNLPELEFVVTTDVIHIPRASATIVVTLTLNSSATLSGNLVALDDTTCIPNPSPPNFVVGCKKSSGSGLIVTATIKNVTDIFNEAVLTLVDPAGSISGWNYPPATLVLKECKTFVVNNEGQTLTVTANQTPYTYDQKGSCSCTGVNGALHFNNGTEHSGAARCNEMAQWNGCENAQCWFAPQNVTVSQKNNITNEPADLVCSYDDGFPAEFQEIYYIGEMEVLSSKILQPDLHMKSYKCAVGNNYTDLSENKAESETETLIVYFAPEKLLPSSLRIGIAENETEEVFFTFRANSPDNVTTTFSKINGSKLEHIYEDITSQGYYNITYFITINSNNDYGEYVFIASTSVPPGSATQTITITEYDNTRDPTDTQNNIVIIASTCAALLVVIIALVILLVLYRKRRREKLSETSTNKEEKDNPLYGITTRDNSAGEPSSTKEERANPLYDTNSGTPDKVEEAYAAVDVRKKKKKKENKGTENSAFSPESNAAVYAAVDKSKKKKNDAPPVEAVYSEVNKKKGSNTAGLHGSSE